MLIVLSSSFHTVQFSPSTFAIFVLVVRNTGHEEREKKGIIIPHYFNRSALRSRVFGVVPHFVKI